jgi:GTPase Era involved in 16S rRNA processing
MVETTENMIVVEMHTTLTESQKQLVVISVPGSQRTQRKLDNKRNQLVEINTPGSLLHR